jgi:hypothetical protein
MTAKGICFEHARVRGQQSRSLGGAHLKVAHEGCLDACLSLDRNGVSYLSDEARGLRCQVLGGIGLLYPRKGLGASSSRTTENAKSPVELPVSNTCRQLCA